MPDAEAEYALRQAVAEFHSRNGLPWQEGLEVASFERCGVAFTFALNKEAAPFLWIGCDLGPVDLTGDPAGLRWLLQESFELWACARIHAGCNAGNSRAVASFNLYPEHAHRLDDIIEMLAHATGPLRDRLASGKFPNTPSTEFDMTRIHI